MFQSFQVRAIFVLLAVGTLSLMQGQNVSGGTLPGANGLLALTLDSNVATLDPVSGNIQMLADGRAPSWSPDGAKLVFNEPDGSVVCLPVDGVPCPSYLRIIDADGGNLTELTNGYDDTGASWSPDGGTILFSRLTDDEAQSGLYVISANGTNPPTMIPGTSGATNAEWSPDGTKISFLRLNETANQLELYIANTNGTSQRRLAEVNDGAKWSPDGTQLASSCYTGPAPEHLCFIDASTGSVTHWPDVVGFRVTWSPDGSKLAFVSYENHPSAELYIINSDGTGQRRVTTNSFVEDGPDWQPLSMDTDKDGLPDAWEIYGVDGLNLASMGSDPEVPDVFVYIDYMAGFKPSTQALDMVVSAFNQGGINLHYTIGKVLPYLDNYLPANLRDDVKANLPARWTQVAHYVVYADEYVPDSDGCRSGFSLSAPASEFAIAVGCGGSRLSVQLEAGTFMHELGHNLGLCHSGPVVDVESRASAANPDPCDETYAPNYLSVMNYSYQGGLKKSGQWFLDYSRTSIVLNESALDKSHGINAGESFDDYQIIWYCPTIHTLKTGPANGPGINWDCLPFFESGFAQADVNKDGKVGLLHSGRDWDNLLYASNGGRIGVQAGVGVGVLPIPLDPTREATHRLLKEVEEAVEAAENESQLSQRSRTNVAGAIGGIIAPQAPQGVAPPTNVVIVPPSTGDGGLADSDTVGK